MIARHFSSLAPDTRKAIYLICLAVGVVGISYGSLATAYGFPLWVPLFSSLFVLAGASEFMFIAIVAAGEIRWRLRWPGCWSTRAISLLALPCAIWSGRVFPPCWAATL